MNKGMDGDDDEDENDDNDPSVGSVIHLSCSRVDLGTFNYSSRIDQVAVGSASSIRTIGQLVLTSYVVLTRSSMSAIVSLNTFLNSRRYAKKSEKSCAVSRL